MQALIRYLKTYDPPDTHVCQNEENVVFDGRVRSWSEHTGQCWDDALSLFLVLQAHLTQGHNRQCLHLDIGNMSQKNNTSPKVPMYHYKSCLHQDYKEKYTEYCKSS